MSAIYVYDFPVVLVAEDNDSFTQKRNILVVECEEVIPNELAGLWNNNLCSQDEEYCQPWIKGDKIYAQFKITDPAIISIFPTIKNGLTGEYIWLPDNAVEQIAADNEDGKRFASFTIDTNAIPEGVCCFYVEWNLYYQTVDFGDFSTCVANKVSLGETLLQAIHNCLEELVDPENIEISVDEPYCLEKCRPTIVVAGQYVDYDCNGNYYGLFNGDAFNPYKHSFRIHGEIAQQGYTFEETNINGKKKSSKQVSTWLLRTPKIPPYMADKLAVAFNSEKLTINGAEFRKAEELTKNNEDGFMWIINTTLTTECDEINFTCH